MTHKFFSFVLTLCTFSIKAQTHFFTQDIFHFFQAFDSIQTTTDQERQIAFVQHIYLDQGTPGLTYTINNSVDGGGKASAEDWVNFMTVNKGRLTQIRPCFNSLPDQIARMEEKFRQFKQQYPAFKDGNVYFVMGLGMFAGRPESNNLFIGCELLANEQPDWAVGIVLHEFVHTFQKKSENALLAHCLYEGAADFIAEVIHQKSWAIIQPEGYIAFGERYEKAVWKEFKKFIASNEKWKFFDWLYGTKGRNINGHTMRDLGYFVGYKICQSYFTQATDKQQAIKELIEMDVSTDEKARTFLLQSGYVPRKDLKFIRHFEFTKVRDIPKGQKPVQVGYKIEKSTVVFQFELPQEINIEQVQYITIAGSFNGWNPDDVNFRMNHIKGNLYELNIPKSEIKTQYVEFKFVINGKDWQPVPENASNSNNGNLTLELK